MLLPRLANMRARLKALNSAGPNVASSENSVALTRKPVPGVEKVVPRIRPAGWTPVVPLKKLPGNAFGELAAIGTASQLISRRPVVHDAGKHAPTPFDPPPRSARNELRTPLKATSAAPPWVTAVRMTGAACATAVHSSRPAARRPTE